MDITLFSTKLFKKVSTKISITVLMVLLTAILFSCDKDKDKNNQNYEPDKVKTEDLEKEPEFVLECSYESTRFGQKPKVNYAKDQEAFDLMYKMIHLNKLEKPVQPEVNMKKYNVFFLYGGQMKDKYKKLVINDYSNEKNTLNLKIGLEKDTPNRSRVCLFSTPYCLIKIKKKVDTIKVETDIKYFEKEINVLEMQNYGTQIKVNKKDELDYVHEKEKRRGF
jgi:hypothetical protein